MPERIFQERRVWMTALWTTSCILVLRYFGLVQSLEWGALDQFFRLRPAEPKDESILVVAIDEEDLRTVGKWPLPDGVVAELLEKLHKAKVQAIGLDIYRDIPAEPGHKDLFKAYKSIPNLIGIAQFPDSKSNRHLQKLGFSSDSTRDSDPFLEMSNGVPPPADLPQKQVGFNNVVVDTDGKVRRGLLYWKLDGKVRESFALKLALSFLKTKGILPSSLGTSEGRWVNASPTTILSSAFHPQDLELGQARFRRFQPNDGGYVRTDAGGYQFLANFRQTHCQSSRQTCSFDIVSLRDVLNNRVPSRLLRDRIVLVGSTALSLKDFFYTPYSGGLIGPPQPIAGVELQANFVSQILSAALSGRPLMRVWPEFMASLWIFVWAWLGASLSWRYQSPIRLLLGLFLACSILTGISYFAFAQGWWIPLIPPLITLGSSAIVINSHLAYLQQELKRSKEFLYEIINAIPDPIFVKNKQHQWIVLNDAYCQFIGYPLEALLEKSDYDFFLKHEADNFWYQDNWAFHSGIAQENEEEFTDIRGTTHLIATKRSIHRDGAGNLFLIGVIRDITERKRIEEELKRTAAELFRSNLELKLSEDHLRYLAHHDTLTGLPNRQLFLERLSQSLDWASRHNLLLALLFIDLDGFKQVNDTLGHDSGDCVLQEVAQRLLACLRGSDTVCRLGGDEFTVILPVIPKIQVAATVAEKILATLSEAFVINGQKTYLTASIGISLYPLHTHEIEELIKQADIAMYRAKLHGKNRYEFAP